MREPEATLSPRPDYGQTASRTPPEQSQNSPAERLKNTLITRRKFSADFLTPDGILEIARTRFNVSTTIEHLYPEQYQRFCADVTRLVENPLIVRAILTIALGNLALNRGQVPTKDSLMGEFGSSKHNPLKHYLSALEFLRGVLDAADGREIFIKEHGGKFSTSHWTREWQKAVAQAAAFEYRSRELISRQVADGVTHTGREAPTLARLCDDRGKTVGNFTSFHLCEPRPYAEEQDLATRKLISPADFSALTRPGATLTKKTVSLGEAVFGPNEYPHDRVVKEAMVEHHIAVLPLEPGESRVVFGLAVAPEMTAPNMLIEIITGEGLHTSSGTRRQKLFSEVPALYVKGMSLTSRLSIEKPPGTVMEFEGTSDTSSNPREPMKATPGKAGSELFSGTLAEALGPIRKELALYIGETASTAIILVFKPAVDPLLADARRAVIEYNAGSITDLAFISRYYSASNRDSPTWLQQNGWLSSEKAIRAEALVVEKDQQALQATRMRDSWSRGGDSFSFGGGSMLRGGGFHTGGSGIAGGGFAIGRDSFSTDPFSPPKIIVYHPYPFREGITGA